MTEHFYRDQCPGGHVDDPVLIAEAVARLEPEVVGLRDRESRAIAERAGWERAVRASIRRVQEDHFRYYARHALRDLVDSVGWKLVNFVLLDGGLPDKPTASQMNGLRYVAEQTRAALLTNEPDAGYVDVLVDEVARLRALISEFAQDRHWKAGPQRGDRCECEGCELIRAMDDVPIAALSDVDGRVPQEVTSSTRPISQPEGEDLVTGPEHYRAAEELAARAAAADEVAYSADRDGAARGLYLAEAQVHATLALVAALCTLGHDVEFGPLEGWWQAAGDRSTPSQPERPASATAGEAL